MSRYDKILEQKKDESTNVRNLNNLPWEDPAKLKKKETPQIDVSTSTGVSRNNIIYDPRPDLRHDSVLWYQLLLAAGDRSIELQSALLFMRAMGTLLQKISVNVNNGNGTVSRPSFKLVPYIDPSGRAGWPSQEEYDQEKVRVLGPVVGENAMRDLLIELLGKLAA